MSEVLKALIEARRPYYLQSSESEQITDLKNQIAEKDEFIYRQNKELSQVLDRVVSLQRQIRELRQMIQPQPFNNDYQINYIPQIYRGISQTESHRWQISTPPKMHPSKRQRSQTYTKH